MFEDRSKKSNYDFKKIDAQARTKVEILDKEAKSDAHKKLFGAPEKESQKVSSYNLKQQVKEEIIKHKNPQPVESLPSSNYLKSFEGQSVDEIELVAENVKEEQTAVSDMDFVKLLESANNVSVDTKVINKELTNSAPKPKKNYSFRIKLLTGVYCILVALFGGWIIGNTINISQVNSFLYETSLQTTQVQRNILDIIGDIKKLDSVSSDPENDGLVVKIITEEIEITPEEITAPNDYQKSSNWFDILCNWIATLFGG